MNAMNQLGVFESLHTAQHSIGFVSAHSCFRLVGALVCLTASKTALVMIVELNETFFVFSYWASVNIAVLGICTWYRNPQHRPMLFLPLDRNFASAGQNLLDKKRLGGGQRIFLLMLG